jgi:hypothetical protein
LDLAKECLGGSLITIKFFVFKFKLLCSSVLLINLILGQLSKKEEVQTATEIEVDYQILIRKVSILQTLFS